MAKIVAPCYQVMVSMFEIDYYYYSGFEIELEKVFLRMV